MGEGMLMPLYFDAETVPTDAAMALPYPREERKHPGNISRPETVAKWYEEDEQRWHDERPKTCALSPRTGRVLAIGFAFNDNDPASVVAEHESGEAALLRVFWEAVDAANGEIVTFNGCAFDVPYLLTRSWKHRVTPSISLATIDNWKSKYRTFPHCDVFQALGGSGSLGEWAQFFEVGDKQGLSGKDVYPLYLLRHFDEIASYCRNDVALLRDIRRRITASGLAAVRAEAA